MGIIAVMQSVTKGGMKQLQRVMTIDQQRLWYRVLHAGECFTELRFSLRRLKFLNGFRSRAEFLGHRDNFAENSIFLVLDDPSIVDKGTDSESLILTAPTLEKYVSVGTDQLD